ncbi:cystathione beta-lyase [Polaromonas sp. OV174]|uniref:MalY/PatB family protein n=1 Tax=Polaromonas sp. OV174 TaxID=1855300 RepID=UPI0008EAE6B0|nr:MalY/PatB family protein [Polaromonas sp. OV174]SFC72448.1 cystathione beta-lyase [Polaromonas sp. OV174]
MKFDFDEVVDRRESMSIKWNRPHILLKPDECAAKPLPMWVADMDFKSPPVVVEALHQAVERGIFGYSQSGDSYDEAIVNWQKKRFGWDVSPEWILKSPGVVSALAYIIQAFSSPGDRVLIQAPVYGPFHNIPKVNGRHIVDAPLVERADHYEFDPEIFETAIKTYTPKIFILCNPHNPTGNVWTEAQLRAMNEICLRHRVLVIADEIHQDLIFNRQVKHIPFASLDEGAANNSITCTAPSKTFNVAGLQVSNLFVPNASLRHELWVHMERCGFHYVNYLGMVACEAAYRHGEPWLEALLDYVGGNHRYLAAEIQKSIPQITCFKTDALYLAWLDCRRLGRSADDLSHFLLKEAGVWLDSGKKFGQEGHGFMRINLGCPRATVDEALQRLRQAINR